jgi:hypothetical protein
MRKLFVGGAFFALVLAPTGSAFAGPVGDAAVNDAARSNPVIQEAACRRITRCVASDEGRRCRTVVRCGEGDRDWRHRDRDRDGRDRRRRDHDDD